MQHVAADKKPEPRLATNNQQHGLAIDQRPNTLNWQSTTSTHIQIQGIEPPPGTPNIKGSRPNWGTQRQGTPVRSRPCKLPAAIHCFWMLASWVWSALSSRYMHANAMRSNRLILLSSSTAVMAADGGAPEVVGSADSDSKGRKGGHGNR